MLRRTRSSLQAVATKTVMLTSHPTFWNLRVYLPTSPFLRSHHGTGLFRNAQPTLSTDSVLAVRDRDQFLSSVTESSVFALSVMSTVADRFRTHWRADS